MHGSSTISGWMRSGMRWLVFQYRRPLMSGAFADDCRREAGRQLSGRQTSGERANISPGTLFLARGRDISTRGAALVVVGHDLSDRR